MLDKIIELIHKTNPNYNTDNLLNDITTEYQWLALMLSSNNKGAD